MGLGKFVAGRIHQMRAAKSYLAAHPSWFNENPNPTCPQIPDWTRVLPARHPRLPRPLTGPRSPAERSLLPGARCNNMVRPPPHTSIRRVHHRHENRLTPRHAPRPLFPPLCFPYPRFKKHMFPRGGLLFEFPTLWLTGCLISFRISLLAKNA